MSQFYLDAGFPFPAAHLPRRGAWGRQSLHHPIRYCLKNLRIYQSHVVMQKTHGEDTYVFKCTASLGSMTLLAEEFHKSDCDRLAGRPVKLVYPCPGFFNTPSLRIRPAVIVPEIKPSRHVFACPRPDRLTPLHNCCWEKARYVSLDH